MRKSVVTTVAILAVLAVFAVPALARSLARSSGQKVYVAVYSHIYQGIKGKPYNLSALLSIRNVDYDGSLAIKSVRYYNSEGTLVKNYLEKPIVVGPMATKEFYIPERDTEGGSGANFTVEWESDIKISVPIIQAVMIGTASTQGISFVCDGVVIQEQD